MKKVALVTGSSRGIGGAVAKRLAEAGYAVCINYIEQREKAEAVAEYIRARGGEAICCQADVSDAAAVKAMFLYALKWLEIGGYSRNNLPLLESAYSLPENMRSEFCNALDIWQEAVYSVHDIDNEKRETVRQFADECRDYALSDKKAIQKLRIKYKYAL